MKVRILVLIFLWVTKCWRNFGVEAFTTAVFSCLLTFRNWARKITPKGNKMKFLIQNSHKQVHFKNSAFYFAVTLKGSWITMEMCKLKFCMLVLSPEHQTLIMQTGFCASPHSVLFHLIVILIQKPLFLDHQKLSSFCFVFVLTITKLFVL